MSNKQHYILYDKNIIKVQWNDKQSEKQTLAVISVNFVKVNSPSGFCYYI